MAALPAPTHLCSVHDRVRIVTVVMIDILDGSRLPVVIHAERLCEVSDYPTKPRKRGRISVKRCNETCVL